MAGSAERILAEARRGDGFITKDELLILADDDETRLQPVLVRLQGGRFIAPAQDAPAFIDALQEVDELSFGLRDIRIREDVLPGLQHPGEARVQDILRVEGLKGLRDRFGPFDFD